MEPVTELEDRSTLPTEEVGFDVLQLLLVLARRWRLVVTLTLFFGIGGLLYSFTLKPKYSATVTFLVDQESSNTGLSLYRQNDPTVSLLQSKAITEFVLQHIDVKAFATETKHSLNSENARLALRAEVQSETTAAKSDQGLYSLKVQDSAPARAVAIANAYLDALQDLSDRMSFETASRTRAFYQMQVEAERASLEKAQSDLKTEQQRTGLLQPGSQTSLEISQIANLRSQIVGLQVQRANIAQSSTAENPQMVRLNAQIGALQSKAASLQGQISNSSGRDLPSQNLEVGRLEQTVEYHQSLLTSLASQFERARLQENYGVPKVHTVDRASLPIPRTFPKNLTISVVLGAFGFFLALVITGFSETLAHLRKSPGSRSKMKEIRRALPLGKT